MGVSLGGKGGSVGDQGISVGEGVKEAVGVDCGVYVGASVGSEEVTTVVAGSFVQAASKRIMTKKMGR